MLPLTSPELALVKCLIFLSSGIRTTLSSSARISSRAKAEDRTLPHSVPRVAVALIDYFNEERRGA